MTKATGRGRGWRKKKWSDLAPSTRKRYEQSGINAQRHAAGASRRDWDQFLDRQQRYYGRDRDEMREELADYDKGALIDAVMLQRKMQELYDQGRMAEARALWEARDQNLPAWLYWYHGAFS